MKDTECSETNEKSIFPYLVFEIWSFLYSKMVNFFSSKNFRINVWIFFVHAHQYTYIWIGILIYVNVSIWHMNIYIYIYLFRVTGEKTWIFVSCVIFPCQLYPELEDFVFDYFFLCRHIYIYMYTYIYTPCVNVSIHRIYTHTYTLWIDTFSEGLLLQIVKTVD